MNGVNEKTIVYETGPCLEFITRLGKEMLVCGANIERVYLAVMKFCKRYNLKDVTAEILSTSVSLSAKNAAGEYAFRQARVPATGINLDLLRKLNRFSYDICARQVSPELLMAGLDECLSSEKVSPWWLIYAGYILAMLSLCRIFGGSWAELLVTVINTSVLYGISLLLSKVNINKVITNFICMFIVTAVSFLFTYIGFVTNFYCVIITGAFFLIPGIPMVNAIRNILCGNEMNGIISLLKVVLEVISIVAGLAAAFALFGSWYLPKIEDTISVASKTYSKDNLLSDAELIVLSFICSLSFGIVFKIGIRDWALAGLGGTTVRIMYIIFMYITPYRIVYTLIASFVAALYAEILAIIRKEPGTLYLYPSIIPLIPGDLLYYTLLGVVWNNSSLMQNFGELLIQLMAMSVGFVICSTVIHYVRKIKLNKLIKTVKKIKTVK